MLARAFVPLVRSARRTPNFRSLTAAPFSAIQYRAFADSRKPGASPQAGRQRQTRQSQRPVEAGDVAGSFSSHQDEFQTAASPSRNTTPNAQDIDKNRQRTSPLTSSSQNSAAKEEEEINTFAESGAEKNTTPDGSSTQQPLPDLTQGIPSTLDAELQQAARSQRARKQGADEASLNITEDPAQPEVSAEGPGGPSDGLPKTSYVSSADRRRQAQFRWGYYAILAAITSGIVMLGRNWDTYSEEEKHPDAPSGWTLGAFSQRFKARLFDTMNWYKEPAFAKLLPDPDPDPAMQPPFTLVVSLEDLLMHSEWTREHGWRIAKRPGVDYFIRYLSQYYEIVVWTSQPMMNAEPILRKLDPFRLMRWWLFREATLYEGGEHVKDLSYLNRDLSKVLVIDTNTGHAKNQPENAIILPKWKGDPKDTTLLSMIPFLEYLALMGLEDTRAVLKSFDGKDIPTEFAKREKIMRDKFEAKLAAETGKKSFSLGSAFGGKSPEKPKMLWDQLREQGRKQYELLDKEIRENGAKWLAEMEAEEKKVMEEALKSGKGVVQGIFGGGNSSQ